ncbi:winged helix-turn-helix domain-containing protein [Mollicutes bacterium LVI A0078]|nr:winged helix-turn-helix domain-containing protein [Mollicutes bacterium LVI A0075]WOO91648.1 winged helix-turn-helix domain-containing protein [Mollicutes bacterium LVI A0078]
MNILTIDVGLDFLNKLREISILQIYELDLNTSFLDTRDSNIILIDIDTLYQDKLAISSFLRKENNFIIFLSSNYTNDDRLRYYSYGASLVIKKPCHAMELLYCINNVFNYKNKLMPNYKYEDENFVINYKTHEVEFRGTLIKMSPLLVDALILLVENRDVYLNREEMIGKLYKHREEPKIRAIDTIITNLRHITDPVLFETKRGVGYKYIA